MLAICGYAILDALLAIREHGSDVAAGLALAYSAVPLAGGLLVWAWLRPRGAGSVLVAAGAAQWLGSLVLSGGMLVGFAVLVLIRGTPWERAGPYLDPAMVIVAAFLFAPTPIAMIRTTVGELLERAPDPSIGDPVRRAVEEVGAAFGLGLPRLRMTKLGRKLYVEVNFVVPAGRWDIADEDRVRHAIAARMDALGHDVWLTVELSTDPHWGV